MVLDSHSAHLHVRQDTHRTQKSIQTNQVSILNWQYYADQICENVV